MKYYKCVRQSARHQVFYAALPDTDKSDYDIRRGLEKDLGKPLAGCIEISHEEYHAATERRATNAG